MRDAIDYWGKVTFCVVVVCCLYACGARHSSTSRHDDFKSLSEDRSAPTSAVEVVFSPGDTCEETIIAEIKKAKKSIHIQAYGFTSRPIVSALFGAKDRGVSVEVILDYRSSLEPSSVSNILAVNEINTYVDDEHPIAHNKIILIDVHTVITGSYNYSTQAHRNAENLLVLRDAETARQYLENWKEHLAHSTQVK